MSAPAHLASVNAGRIVPASWAGKPRQTAIAKTPVVGPVAVRRLLYSLIEQVGHLAKTQELHLVNELPDKSVVVEGDSAGGSAKMARSTRVVVAAVGPTCAESLRAHGVEPDVEPVHPKMGHMVVALARYWEERGGKSDRSGRNFRDA